MKTLLLLPLVVGFANGFRLSDFIHDAHMSEETFLRMQEKLAHLNDLHHKIRGEEVPKRRPGIGINLDQEIESKPAQLPFLFEGDIILTDEQMDNMIEKAEDLLWAQTGTKNHRRKTRSMTSNLNVRWSASQPIPYYINRGSDVRAVKAGLNFWQDNTCLTFKQENYPLHGNGLSFIRSNGCWSYIGRKGNAPQEVSIGYGCELLGIVAHEIGHALGFYHEQARYDRDNYIQVLDQYITPDGKDQYQKQAKSSMKDYEVKYDYGSVMHYEPSGFSNGYGPTMKTLDPNYQKTIGQRLGASFSDIKKANFAYCTHICPSKLDCQHGGYTDPKNCARCRCPGGFGGDLCERAANSPSECGVGDLTATNTFQTIQARGNSKCSYVITALAGRKVYFEVTDSSFSQVREVCNADNLELKYGEDFPAAGARFCSTSRPTVKLTKTNKLVVIYTGGQSYYGSSSRFALRFRQDPLGPVETTTAPIATTEVPKPQPSTVAPITTTTQRATTTSSIVDPGCSAWSPCTAQCGGCGTQSRRCGSTLQTIRCNIQPCTNGHCCPPYFYTKDGRCVAPYGTNKIADKKIVKHYTEAELSEARNHRGGNGWYQENN